MALEVVLNMKRFEIQKIGMREELLLCEEIKAENSVASRSFPRKNLVDCDRIRFKVFSERKTEHSLDFRIINSDTPRRTRQRSHYLYTFPLDFEGEREFCVDVHCEMQRVEYANLTDIVAVSLCTTPERVNGESVMPSADFSLISVVAECDILTLADGAVATEEDFLICKRNMRRQLLGGGSDEELSIPEYAERAKAAGLEGEKAWENLRKLLNAYRSGDFSEIEGTNQDIKHTVGDEAKIEGVYRRIRTIVIAYSMRGSHLYKNPELLTDIIEALDLANEKFYGVETTELGVYGNWWAWHVGVSLSLLPTLILLEDELGEERVNKYLYPFDFLVPWPAMTMANRIWLAKGCIASALLHRDAVKLVKMRKMLLSVFEYVSGGDGFYTDGSFIQHKHFAYTSGYGLSLISDVAKLVQMLGNSPFAFSEPVVDNHYKWIFDSFRPVIYKNAFFAATNGRAVSRKTSEGASQKALMQTLLTMIEYTTDGELLLKLKTLAKHLLLAGGGKSVLSKVEINRVLLAKQILEDEAIPSFDGYEKFRIFPKMCVAAMHNERYGACLKLCSRHICRYETINRENMTGWYQGDGVLYRYDGSYDHDFNYFGNIDPYRHPGTTVCSVEREVRDGVWMTNRFSFSGGVECGKVGLAVFELGYREHPAYTSDMTARQSWFFFDKEIVALGSGIRDRSNTEVVTTLENVKLQSAATFVADGEECAILSASEDTRLQLNTKWCHLDACGAGGYVFNLPSLIYKENANDSLQRAVKSKKSTGEYDFTCGKAQTVECKKRVGEVDFLELTINHGCNPEGSCFNYVILPNATLTETEAYSRYPETCILTCDSAAHAILKISRTECGEALYLGFGFFEAATRAGVSSDGQIALMLKLERGGLTVFVSDPTQAREICEITIDTHELSRIISRAFSDEAAAIGEELFCRDKLSAGLASNLDTGELVDAILEKLSSALSPSELDKRITASNRDGKITLRISLDGSDGLTLGADFR